MFRVLFYSISEYCLHNIKMDVHKKNDPLKKIVLKKQVKHTSVFTADC